MNVDSLSAEIYFTCKFIITYTTSGLKLFPLPLTYFAIACYSIDVQIAKVLYLHYELRQSGTVSQINLVY